jgi:hypothetical protein
MHETLERHCTSPFTHYIIIERGEEQLFSPLAGPNTKFLTTRDILPWWLQKMPNLPVVRKAWLSLKTRPVRNWIIQQIVKLSMADYVSEQYMAFVDSDVFFVRPFSCDDFIRGDKFRLFSVPGQDNIESHYPWHRTAASLLGLPERDYFGARYIGNIITWRRDTLLDLHRRIEEINGRPWLEAVLQRWHLSEYVLYGTFVEHVLGDDSGHYVDPVVPCLEYWTQERLTDAGLAEFLGGLKPHHVSVMLSSKAGIPVTAYRGHLAEMERHAERLQLRGLCLKKR